MSDNDFLNAYDMLLDLSDSYGESNSETAFKKLLDDINAQKKTINGENYIPDSLIRSYFDLIDKYEAKSLYGNSYQYAKTISDMIEDVFKRQIFGNEKNDEYLDNGKKSFNAHASESIFHDVLGFAYGGNGIEDHTYEHTGRGFSGADFKLDKDYTLIVVDNNNLKEIILPKGTEIDAKDYRNEDSMKSYLDNNTNGKLGHFGDYILAHMMTNDACYLIENSANGKIFKIAEDFSKYYADKKYRQIKNIGKTRSSGLLYAYYRH